jgi:hypothetical protein
MPAADQGSALTPPVTLRRCLMSCVTHVNRRYVRGSTVRRVPPQVRRKRRSARRLLTGGDVGLAG